MSKLYQVKGWTFFAVQCT